MSALSPSDLGEDARQDYGGDFEDQFLSNQSSTVTNLPNDIMTGNESVTMVSQDAFDAAKNVKTIVERPEAFITTDEETRLLSAPGSDVNSPRDMVSPSAGSSPFSAMESDGEGIETGMDDASLSGLGDTSFQRSNGYFGASTPLEYTTTPCASSSACDDDFESTGSRKKRRKTRRDINAMYHMPGPIDNGIASLRFARATTQEPWQHDQETSPFSPPTCPKSMNFNFAENNSRRGSGAASTNALASRADCSDDNAKRPRTSDVTVNGEELQGTSNIPVKIEMPTAMDTPVSMTKSALRRHHAHSHHAEEEQILLKQFPRKVNQYELKIVTQPESQHRARYLTEGSRGPVKDSTQRGFPEVQLLGYDGSATLQVFVATDSGKVKPHGFYQACRVTGRNTSQCEETEIDGTKVIEIPFKQENMLLSIDCVGILKLRNTDVEVRTGIRNPKRNQSVRLLFRVVIPTPDRDNITLQIASSRISCTQPLGQPEITKKSVDRCSVEGGIEMFIIGKNFHRGTKVIYQDPEEPNGTQWCAEGEVDKDTFHQSHMVVRVPPYHDQGITKPVNVQLLVEFQDKKCEPHSFTYTPRQKEPEPPKDEPKKVSQSQSKIGASNIESALHLLDGPIDKKFLVALFSKLLTAQPDGPSTAESPEPAKPEAKAPLPAPNVATLTAPLINAAAGPILQGMLQPLQTQTVVEVVPNEPMKAEVNSVSANPASVPITTNPFANIQFTFQPKMSFTQDLNSTVVQSPANPVPLATPVTQINFNPNPAQVTTSPLSNISFAHVPSGGPIPISQVVFNPPPNAISTNPNTPLFTPQTIPTAGISTSVSHVNPLTQVGLPTSVFPSVGNLPASFAVQNVKVKSETSAPDIMPNVTHTNVQTIPALTSVSNPTTAFGMCIPQTTQVSVAFTEKPLEAAPPMVVSPVSQPQLAQEAVLYNSFSTSHTETQPNATPEFGSTSISFVGNSAVKVDQPPVLSFSNPNLGQVSSQSLPQAFNVSSVTSTPSPQLLTQAVTNFQVSPGQQIQQNVFAPVTANQNTQFNVTSPPASHSQGTIVQNVANSITSFVPDHNQMGTAAVQQITNSFESPFVEKKVEQHNNVQMSHNGEIVQVVQNANIVGSQQFTMSSSQQQLQMTNLVSQSQPQFEVAVQETAPTQQEQHRVIQEQSPQNLVGFSMPKQQQQFASGMTDRSMTQDQQQTVVVNQQQISVNNHMQQQQKSGFSEMSPQQFSIGSQDQPMQQILQSAQGQPIAQQPSMQMTQQTGVQMSQQPSVQMAQQPSVQMAQQPSVQMAQQPGVQMTQQPSVQMAQQPSVQMAQQPNLQMAQQPNLQMAQQPTVQMAQQPSLQMAQQPSVQIAQQPIVTQIVQVLQTPPNVTHSQRPQDNQMHVDPFVEPQSAATNLQSSSNVFNAQQPGVPNVSAQPMEDVAMVSIANRTGDQHMKDLSMAQIQQTTQQQPFKIPHQAVPAPVVSEAGGAQTFQGQPPPIFAPVSMKMQPVVQAAVIPAQEFQSIPQPSNPPMVVTPEQNSPSTQQICSPNTSTQPNVIMAGSVTQQTFQPQSNSQNVPSEPPNVTTMQPPQYQSPEAATKSPPSLPATPHSGFPAMTAQTPQSSEQIQISSNHLFQNTNDAQMQQQVNTRSEIGNNISLQQRVLAASINATHPMEPRSPDLFAMTQLLQSIDGSANLETITGEDVQRHCQ